MVFPKKKTLTALEVIEKIMTPSDASLDTMLDMAFSFVKPEWLERAIKLHLDPVPYIQDWFDSLESNPILKMMHGSGKHIARRIMALWWRGYLDEVLSNTERLKEYMCKDPDLCKLIDTPEGISYLNYMGKRVYDWAYTFVWETPD